MRRPFLAFTVSVSLVSIAFSSARAALTFTAESKIVAVGTTSVDVSIRVTGDPTDNLQFYALQVDLSWTAGSPNAAFVNEATLTGLTDRTTNPDYILNGKGVDSTGASPQPVVRETNTRLLLQDGVSIPQVTGPGGPIDNGAEAVGATGRLVANVRFNVFAPGIAGFVDVYTLTITPQPNVGVKQFAASGTPGGSADFLFSGGAATDVSLDTVANPNKYEGTDLTNTDFAAGSVSAVPEPNSLVLLTAAGLGLLIRRRRH